MKLNKYQVHFENEKGDVLTQEVTGYSLRDAVISAINTIRCKPKTKFIPIGIRMLEKDETINYNDIRSDYVRSKKAV